MIEGLIREEKSLSPSKPFMFYLMDDPAYAEPSVLVPDDVKSAIDAWSADMQLSNVKRKKKDK